MGEFTSYRHGTPSWVDLGTTDLAAAREFYGRLLGWSYEVGPPETSYYTLCRLRDRNVAGMYELMPELTAQGVPPNWATYIDVDSADDVAKRIAEAGGEIVQPPMDVMDQGRVLMARDPSGAVFGCWQPGSHIGAQLANEPGTLTWNELLSRDVDAALRFYTTVFGHGTQQVDAGGQPYTLLTVADHPIGGLMAMPAEVPAEVPSYWLTYFLVDDTDAAVATARGGGGQVKYGPTDSPYGRMAVLADP